MVIKIDFFFRVGFCFVLTCSMVSFHVFTLQSRLLSCCHATWRQADLRSVNEDSWSI